MLIGEIIRVALQSIVANLFRAGLTMLGVVIGVSAVIAMVALGEGAQRAVNEQIEALGADILSVTTSRWMSRGVARDQTLLTVEDAEALKNDGKYIKAVVPIIDERQTVKLGNQNLRGNVIGTTTNYPDVHAYQMLAGRMFGDADGEARARVAVVGENIAKELELAPAAMVGESVMIKSVPFRIIGVFQDKGSSMFSRGPENTVWIPLPTAQFRVAGTNFLETIDVQVADTASMEQSMVDIERILRHQHQTPPGQDNNFAIMDRKQFLSVQQQTTQIFTFLLAGIAGVSLVVGGIGIMNIMLVTVTERTREIGVRMALGATRRSILAQFLVESMTLCIIGGLAGIGLGWLVANAMATFAGWQTFVSPNAVAIAFGFSAAIGLFFGLLPARRASKLDPIAALRYE
jgi:putative ABC transport system permease protein